MNSRLSYSQIDEIAEPIMIDRPVFPGIREMAWHVNYWKREWAKSEKARMRLEDENAKLRASWMASR